jgi:hypothetical protein
MPTPLPLAIVSCFIAILVPCDMAFSSEAISCLGPRNQLETETEGLAHLEVQLAEMLRQVEKARASVRDRQLKLTECESSTDAEAGTGPCHLH